MTLEHDFLEHTTVFVILLSVELTANSYLRYGSCIIGFTVYRITKRVQRHNEQTKNLLGQIQKYVCIFVEGESSRHTN